MSESNPEDAAVDPGIEAELNPPPLPFGENAVEANTGTLDPPDTEGTSDGPFHPR